MTAPRSSVLLVVSLVGWDLVAASFDVPQGGGKLPTIALVECLAAEGSRVSGTYCAMDWECSAEDGSREADNLWEGLEYHDGRRVTSVSDPIATRRDCVLTIGDDATVSYYTAFRPKGPGGEVVGIVKAGTRSEITGTGGKDQPPFYIVLLEARLVDTAPPVDLDEMERVANSALARMGFTESEDYLVLRVENPIDISSVAGDVLSQGSSGPATHRFKKVIFEALSYDVLPAGHGLVYVGGVSEWPTGRDHGSYNYGGQDSQFRSFCYSIGYITCSAYNEECLGHELGHAFGMEHEYNNWYGFNPTDEHRERMAAQVKCAVDYGPNWQGRAWTPDDLANLR